MSAVKRGLGKGLSALLADAGENTDNKSVIEIDINLIDTNKNQPRKIFDEEKLNELAESVKTFGIVSPIIVNPTNGRYMIVAGERRYRAARMAKLATVPIIIKELSSREQMEISIIENLQREDLNAIEEAQALRTLMDEYSLTQEEVSKRISKSRPAIANSLRLLTLPEDVLNMISSGELSAGHARCLVTLPDDNTRIKYASTIVSRGLSVRESEKLVSEFEKPKKTAKPKPKSKENPDIKFVEKNLSSALDTKVTLSGDLKRGKMLIEYYSSEQLEAIYDFITQNLEKR